MKNVRYIALRKFTEGKIDAIQAQYLNEPCIRVSVNDEPLGDISKKECHLKG
jgi:hypothetical protein